ncbi:family 43 glycosylhydrolase [Mucilaginibacter terrae]|uniref:Xylan 1,4-beta-xylosidase n=1 Tax=Mucilaginibacter terrae TaxID=1955052 RepID=A0ABU3GR75_9SPHI|nr:family 43 glycosylhydrolase [Mucilaginibacter terrae]MDT3401991.1 xylan 1,4-beta-xylosidase [Mucilaginibacter terrae]
MNKLYPLGALGILLSCYLGSTAQVKPEADKAFYQSVQTYANPVLPGDHPDPTLLKVGDDFYHCGSTFHFNPYLPIYHSKDLVHWEVISRVLTAPAAKWVSDRPSAGIWQGAITYFYGSYWIYFSAGGQWFCKADSPKGPWSAPVQVKTNAETGPLGYDNSIFVDNDGKPYMIIKNGQKVNRLQALGKDGQLTDKVINLDWINAKLQYSWAEGPVMSKRNGIYYYFPAGDVSGGQYVLKASALTADSTKWERLGNFFKPITDAKVGFRRPNHIAAPVQLKDGSWWTIGQSYEKYDNDDWSGLGRQTALYPVTWEGDRPWGMAPTTQPVVKPNLPQGGISWRSVESDYFDESTLGLPWHFLTKKAAESYSLNTKKGWITLTPDTSRAHIMQKETDHWYSAVTKVDLNASAPAEQAGFYVSNGNQKVTVKLYSGYDGGKKIIFKMDTAVRSVPNTFGDVVWLKLERNEHQLTGYCSADGKIWTSLGQPISAINLDKAQPNFNSWVGTSVGLFAEGKPASFDLFICKDGKSDLPAVGFSNYYGVERKDGTVTTTTNNGGWFMLSGVEMGNVSPSAISINTSGIGSAKLEIWADDIEMGKLLASFSLKGEGASQWKLSQRSIKKTTGQHDVFVRFLPGAAQSVSIKSIRFID